VREGGQSKLKDIRVKADRVRRSNFKRMEHDGGVKAGLPCRARRTEGAGEFDVQGNKIALKEGIKAEVRGKG